MKIKRIVIHNLQGYVRPTEIKLSDGLTLIKGDNSSGKTAIARVLKAYTESVKSKDMLRSLLTRGADIGYSDVEVLNTATGETHIVRHCVHKVPSSVRLNDYYEIYAGGDRIYRTERHDEQILKYMGFETIPEPNGCFPLNFKGSKVNAFTDTPLMTNTYILEGLCNIDDYEVRIANIKEAIDRLTLVRREYNQHWKYYAMERNKLQHHPTEELEHRIMSAVNTKIKLAIVKSQIEFFVYKREKLQSNEVLKRVLKLEEITNNLLAIRQTKSVLEEKNKLRTYSIASKILTHKGVELHFLEQENNISLGQLLKKSEHILGGLHLQNKLKSEFLIGVTGRFRVQFYTELQNSTRSLSEIKVCKQYIKDREELIKIDNLLKQISKVQDTLYNLEKIKDILLREEELAVITKIGERLDKISDIKNVTQAYTELNTNKEVNNKLYPSMLNVLNRKITNSVVTEYYAVSKYNKKLNKKLDELEERFKTVVPICPTCGQSWTQGRIQERVI